MNRVKKTMIRPLTPKGVANRNILQLTLTLRKLDILDDAAKLELYFNLRDYWLFHIAKEERAEWERLHHG